MNVVSPSQPSLAPRLLTEDRDFLVRAVEKWLKFQTAVWDHVNHKLEREVKSARRFSLLFRITIIVLSATVTTVSDIDGVPRTAVTVLAGALTALTGIEAFLRFGERQSEAKKQQREIEALRDKLRFEWFVTVEVEGETSERLKAARSLLQRGPEEYNSILTKYALKGDSGSKPQVST